MTENDRAPPTPGPWKLGPLGQGIERILIQTADVHNGQRVCFICDETGDDPTADANARLMAAAPDLLDALDMMVSGLEWRIENDPPDLIDDSDHEALAQCRAAVAKATGT